MQYIEPRPGIGYVLLENFFNVSWSETFLFQAEQGKDFRKQVTPNTPPPNLIFLQERHPLIILHLLNRKDNCWISVLVYEKRWKLRYEDLAKWCEACLKLLTVLRPETLAVSRKNWQILSVSREKR